jgi:hypothetical protein
MTRNDLIEQLFQIALNRILNNYDPDLISYVCICLLKEEPISTTELETIFNLHLKGPWSIDTKPKLNTICKWYNQSPLEFELGEPSIVNGITVYKNNLGHCVFIEAADNQLFAIWTECGRVYISFKDAETVETFKNIQPESISMQITTNTNNLLLIVEESLLSEITSNLYNFLNL